LRTVPNITNNGKWFPYLFVCLSVLVVYLPSFTAEFILDDHPLIEHNSYLKEWHSIGSYLFQEDGFDPDSTNKHTGYYRPLVNLSYTLDYKIWGMNGPGFRITNLILHLLVCFALLSFYRQILERKDVALWIALIFSIHPIATESVSWIAARNNMLVTLFGILSFYFYIRAYKEQKYFFYILSVFLFTLSLFSKEFGLMLLPIFFIYQRTFDSKKEDILKELREYTPFIIIGLIYSFLRQNVIGSFISPTQASSDIFMRIYNLPYVLLLNLKIFFLPYNLHSYIVKISDSYISIGPLCGILFCVIAIYLLWIFRKKGILLFSACAFFFAIFPASGIIPTSSTSIIAMRWLYFPAVFILIILYQPIEKLMDFKSRIAFLIMVCIALYLGFNSYVLNRNLWHSDEDFSKQEVLHFNNMFYADVLAHIYFFEGKYDLAEKCFVKNFENGVYRPYNYIEYAIILYKKDKIDDSLINIDKARLYHPTKEHLGLIFNTKGLAYLKLKDSGRALKEFRKAVLFWPVNALFWENLGIAYSEVSEHRQAIDSFKKSVRMGSNSANIINNLSLSYVLNNECQKAVLLLDRKGYRENDRAKELLERAKRCLSERKDPVM
jgi:protein O-mannosyl-transferase